MSIPTRAIRGFVLVSLLLAGVTAHGMAARADAPGNAAFQRTWERTDQPVIAGAVARTWMWGPQANTGIMQEPYAESPGGQRDVQYFDKSRMEITDPSGDASSIWYVTNGLLATELVTGRVQVGDNTFEQWLPAEVNVAGDADDPTGPTYRSFSLLLDSAPGMPYGVTAGITRGGEIYTNDTFPTYGVRAEHFTPDTFHWIANPFWDFMISSGTVYEDGAYTNAPLFVNPYYATGFPITEPVWAHVKVAGVYRDVLIQVFQRRVLTYTPGNPEGFIVEAGNVGQHYWIWRHVQGPPVSTLVVERYDGEALQGEIWSLRADESHEHDLTSHAASDTSPALSPDGTRIAFASDRDNDQNDFDIWVMDVDGGNLQHLTSTIDQEYSPAWSPDGRQIAYTRVVDGENYEIYVMNADGSDQHDISNNDAYDASPDWSPNGLWIAFVSKREGNAGDIWVMISSGASPQRLTDADEFESMPDWSPDGTRIAYAYYDDGAPGWDVFVMQADGSGKKQWTFNDGDDTNPDWSPDGTQLAFIHEVPDQDQLWVMDEGGLNQHRIGEDAPSYDDVSWGLVPAALAGE